MPRKRSETRRASLTEEPIFHARVRRPDPATRGRPHQGPLTLGRATDNALGAYLRARREAIGRATWGWRPGPGVAHRGRAGRSSRRWRASERGSDRHPSAQMIGALADVLGLSPEERVHAHRMVKVVSNEVCIQAQEPSRTVRPTVLARLRRLEPTSALVVAPHCDVLACTDGFRRLAAPSWCASSPAIPGACTAFPVRGRADWVVGSVEWAGRSVGRGPVG